MNKQERESKALTSWVEAMQQLGEYVVGFQELDATLGACISALVSSDKQVGRMVTAELSSRAKLNVFVSLALHRLCANQLPRSLDVVVKEIEDCEQRRNSLIHSLWDYHPKDPDLVKRVKQRCSRRKGFERSEEFILPEDLYDSARSFEKTAERLYEAVNEHLPKYAKRM